MEQHVHVADAQHGVVEVEAVEHLLMKTPAVLACGGGGQGQAAGAPGEQAGGQGGDGQPDPVLRGVMVRRVGPTSPAGTPTKPSPQGAPLRVIAICSCRNSTSDTKADGAPSPPPTKEPLWFEFSSY